MNKTQNKDHNLAYYQKYLTLLTLFLFALCCLFAWNFFRAFVAGLTDAFANAMTSIAMIGSYGLPVICFIVFFFDSFIKPNKKVSRYIYSILVILFGLANIVLLGLNFQTLYENSQAGNFSNFTTIGLTYPLDALVVNCLIVILQGINLFILIKPKAKIAFIKDAFRSYGFFKFNIVEKIFITILALITMCFIGDFFNGFLAGGNVKYDGKFIFLMMMIFIIPIMNLIYFLTKPSTKLSSQKAKTIINSCLIGVNLLFAILFIVFVFVFPDFVAHVGKPLFPFDYAVSIPLGPYILLIIIVVSTVFQTINLVKNLLVKKDAKTEK